LAGSRKPTTCRLPALKEIGCQERHRIIDQVEIEELDKRLVDFEGVARAKPSKGLGFQSARPIGAALRERIPAKEPLEDRATIGC
jgi:hypothetical protein